MAPAMIRSELQSNLAFCKQNHLNGQTVLLQYFTVQMTLLTELYSNSHNVTCPANLDYERNLRDLQQIFTRFLSESGITCF